MSYPELNEKLFEQVNRHILRKPARLRMSTWIESKKFDLYNVITGAITGKYLNFGKSIWGEPKKVKLPSCNTVGCYAGWTCIVGKEVPGLAYQIPENARQLLGLRQGESGSLFYVDQWPRGIAARYKKARTQRQRAKLVVERARQFMKEVKEKRANEEAAAEEVREYNQR